MLSASDQLVLNELLVLHERSLAAYIVYAFPWIDSLGSSEAGEILREVAASHQSYADEVGEMLLSDNAVVHHGEFPMAYTGYHDLGVDFMMGKMVASETATIERLKGCVDRAESDRVKAVAEQSLGASQAHLQEIEEYLASVSS